MTVQDIPSVQQYTENVARIRDDIMFLLTFVDTLPRAEEDCLYRMDHVHVSRVREMLRRVNGARLIAERMFA